MNKPLRGAWAPLLLLACFLLSLLAAPAIDSPALRAHAAEGAAILRDQGAAPELAGGFKSARLDNFTAVLILKTAAYTGGEPYLWRAFGGYRTELAAAEGEDAWDAFCAIADGRESPTGGLSYSRYWLGFTLPLRLLLCFLDVPAIQMLGYAAQTALLCLAALLLARRRLSRLIPGFLLACFLMMPAATGLCFQYLPITLIALCGVVLLLAFPEGIERRLSFPVYFILLGMTANFFDILTFPLIALCFPLVCLIALRMEAGASLRALLKEACLCALAWGMAYGGLWALKWLLNGLIFGWGYAFGVVSQIALRVSSASGGVSFSRLSVLRENLYILLGKPAYRIIALLVLAGIALSLLRRKNRQPDVRALALLLPAALPVLWILAMANHSFDHSYYTYRTLAGGLFACYAFAACCLRGARR